eukprot:TRINITY_DN1164_c0_g1_i1.p1 TRINITY_DN1164_c0_g1~~TRINITY_DN1164_c0_g1_i1.p1  ORF type:complete len:776 (-),score=209.02 TRINITY_DN1164_c0_g1_i1:24-2078(-)
MYPVTVQNNLSNTETPNVVCFREHRRFIGEEALASITRMPNSTLWATKRFLGKDLASAQTEQTFLPAKLEDDTGYAALRMEVGDGMQVRPEQGISMLLKQTQSYITPHTTDAPFVGAALAVPRSFDVKQRRALLDAAEIAGLKVVDIVDDITAVALSYGFRRDSKVKRAAPEQAEAEEKPVHVLFVDMGHAYFNAQVVAFTHRQLKVLSSVSDDSVGGRNLDFNLVKHFAAELKTKFDVDVFKNARTMMKLQQAAEKSKKILSTIDETLFEADNIADNDFRAKISRAKFEELNREVLNKVKELVASVVSQSGVKPEDLHAVEIVGGGSRVPGVQEAITSVVGGKTLSKTLDSAASVAFGAALAAAIATPELKLDYVVVSERITLEDVQKDDSIGLSKEAIAKYAALEQELEARDNLVTATQDKKNELEQYVYNRRTMIEDSAYASYISKEEKEAVFKLLDSAYQWIDANSDAKLEQYQEELTSIQKQVDEAAPKLRDRLAELEEERKKALEEAAALLVQQQNAEKKPPRSKKQKLEAAEKKKNQGNILFKDFDYENAARQYTEGLGYLTELYDLSPDETATVNTLKSTLHLNVAAACMKINRHKQAFENCSEAVKLDDKNMKALFRRAQAAQGLKRYEDARKDLDAALVLAPENAEVKREAAKVQRLIAQQKANEKKVYAKMFS